MCSPWEFDGIFGFPMVIVWVSGFHTPSSFVCRIFRVYVIMLRTIKVDILWWMFRRCDPSLTRTNWGWGPVGKHRTKLRQTNTEVVAFFWNLGRAIFGHLQGFSSIAFILWRNNSPIPFSYVCASAKFQALHLLHFWDLAQHLMTLGGKCWRTFCCFRTKCTSSGNVVPNTKHLIFFLSRLYSPNNLALAVCRNDNFWCASCLVYAGASWSGSLSICRLDQTFWGRKWIAHLTSLSSCQRNGTAWTTFARQCVQRVLCILQTPS